MAAKLAFRIWWVDSAAGPPGTLPVSGGVVLPVRPGIDDAALTAVLRAAFPFAGDHEPFLPQFLAPRRNHLALHRLWQWIQATRSGRDPVTGIERFIARLCAPVWSAIEASCDPSLDAFKGACRRGVWPDLRALSSCERWLRRFCGREHAGLLTIRDRELQEVWNGLRRLVSTETCFVLAVMSESAGEAPARRLESALKRLTVLFGNPAGAGIEIEVRCLASSPATPGRTSFPRLVPGGATEGGPPEGSVPVMRISGIGAGNLEDLALAASPGHVLAGLCLFGGLSQAMSDASLDLPPLLDRAGAVCPAPVWAPALALPDWGGLPTLTTTDWSDRCIAQAWSAPLSADAATVASRPPLIPNWALHSVERWIDAGVRQRKPVRDPVREALADEFVARVKVTCPELLQGVASGGFSKPEAFLVVMGRVIPKDIAELRKVLALTPAEFEAYIRRAIKNVRIDEDRRRKKSPTQMPEGRADIDSGPEPSAPVDPRRPGPGSSLLAQEIRDLLERILVFTRSRLESNSQAGDGLISALSELFEIEFGAVEFDEIAQRRAQRGLPGKPNTILVQHNRAREYLTDSAREMHVQGQISADDLPGILGLFEQIGKSRVARSKVTGKAPLLPADQEAAERVLKSVLDEVLEELGRQGRAEARVRVERTFEALLDLHLRGAGPDAGVRIPAGGQLASGRSRKAQAKHEQECRSLLKNCNDRRLEAGRISEDEHRKTARLVESLKQRPRKSQSEVATGPGNQQGAQP